MTAATAGVPASRARRSRTSSGTRTRSASWVTAVTRVAGRMDSQPPASPQCAHRVPDEARPAGLDDLTVLICTRNNARLLDRRLESIAGQALPPGARWEVLVV